MASPVDKLTPADPRVQHRTYKVPASGTTYHYLLAEPESTTTPAATILLVHGFPDLSFGWRYQVPHLLSLNLRVVVPDLVGFGRSDAPADLAAYSHKTVVEDLVAVVQDAQGKKEGEEVEKFLLGGHDWGGAVVWRFALWRPDVLRGVFSVCTPYVPASETYLSPEEVAKRLPNFAYQVQFGGTEVEKSVQGRARIRALLSTMYGGRRADGEPVFSVASGVDLDKLEADKIGDSPLMSKEELDFYADEYVKNGMRGPLCWYKTRKVNFDEEKELLEKGRSKVTVPALMIMASRDSALPPIMAAGMDKYVDDLVKKEVDASHWALWERPAETNRHIEEFLTGILKGQPLKASI